MSDITIRLDDAGQAPCPKGRYIATVEGRVTFKKGLKGRTFISVLPAQEAAE